MNQKHLPLFVAAFFALSIVQAVSVPPKRTDLSPISHTNAVDDWSFAYTNTGNAEIEIPTLLLNQDSSVGAPSTVTITLVDTNGIAFEQEDLEITWSTLNATVRLDLVLPGKWSIVIADNQTGLDAKRMYLFRRELLR